jgi:hypothetical protein
VRTREEYSERAALTTNVASAGGPGLSELMEMIE